MGLFGKRATRLGPAPISGKELVLADLDGVVYRGALAIDHAVEQLNRAAETVRLGYLTNNASRTADTVATQLRGFGLHAKAEDIVTSPQAATALLQKTVPPGATVLVVGGDGLVDELTKAGYRVTRSADDAPAAVVQGFAPHVGWEHLAEAAFALAEQPGRELLPWIATNTDWTLPLERGLAPGNGTLVSAVHTAVARLPEFAGKPETAIFEQAFARFNTRQALMIGDRLDTDSKGARAAGIASLHVLTGVDRPKQLVAASADMRPDYIVPSLAGLHEPYPETETLSDGTAKVGKAHVRMDGHIVRVVQRGDSQINLLRAGCAAIWASGLAIYALEVPKEIYEDHWG
jgi:glycerol 3-phosphatase-2